MINFALKPCNGFFVQFSLVEVFREKEGVSTYVSSKENRVEVWSSLCNGFFVQFSLVEIFREKEGV